MSLYTMKFGGTSVGSPEAMRQVVDIVQARLETGSRVIVVVSAMSGVTDLLIDAARKSAAGNKWGYLASAETLRERHLDALSGLVPADEDRSKSAAEINALVDDYLEVCKAIHILGELTPRIMDAIVSFGERLSSRVVAAAMRAQGIQARQCDATQFIVTDDVYQNASPLWDATQAQIELRSAAAAR